MSLIENFGSLREVDRISLFGFLLLFTIGITTLAVYALIHNSLNRKKAAEDKLPSFFTPQFMRDYFYFLIHPIYVSLLAMGLTPDSVSVLSAVVGLMSAIFAAIGWFFWSGFALLFSAVLDTIDGQIARQKGGESKSGAFLDSVLDRYVDFALYGGLLYFFTWNYQYSGVYQKVGIVAVFLTLVGSGLISYVKERGSNLGVTDNRGIMQRGDRMVFLCTALIYDPVIALFTVSQDFPDVNHHYGLIIALWSIGVLIHISVILKIIRIRNGLVKFPG